MELSSLRPAEGSKHKASYRKGRGHGSGNGKTAGYGHKGQKARSGAPRPGFEGGQMPLYRRLPKRGFTCRNHVEYALVNVSGLDRFEDGTTVTPELLEGLGVVSDMRDGLKILGRGEIKKKLTVRAQAFSQSARAKIEAAGGSCEVI